jgi:ABC-2 type transport system permease protein
MRYAAVPQVVGGTCPWGGRADPPWGSTSRQVRVTQWVERMGAVEVQMDQAAVFRRLRWCLWRNGLRVAWQQGRTRLITVLLTSSFTATFTFGLSYFLFRQLTVHNIPVKGAIAEALFDLLFFSLGTMLLFSAGLILYASLFPSAEVRFLLTTPARPDRIFASKFFGAATYSSWGFVVLGIPIFLAYGWVSNVPWYYYLLVPAYLTGYVLVPASVAAWVCLVVIRYGLHRRRWLLTALAILAAALVVWWLYRVGLGLRRTLSTSGREVQELLDQFAWVRSNLIPSRWMTRGVVAAARGDLWGALWPLAQVWSNGAMLYVVAAWTASRLYRRAYDQWASSQRSRKVYRPAWSDRFMARLVGYLSPAEQALVVKDFRTFRRDPSQWGVLVIFTLLMLLGAGNFRRAQLSDLGRLDQYLISLMNFFGVTLLLCAALTRFVFPLISLEGKKFWVLGLAPLPRRAILRSKLAFAITGALLFAGSLILVADLLIGLPTLVIGVHLAAIGVIAVGLSALNVGLGAALADYQQTDPSKIVVGFGGTVNMVLGLGYMVVIMGLTVVPLHLVQMGRGNAWPPPLWTFAGWPLSLLLAWYVCRVSLRRGSAALQVSEF